MSTKYTMVRMGMKVSKLLMRSLQKSKFTYMPTILTKYIHCSNEENLDPSLLDKEDTPMAADGMNEDIPLEDYLDDANDAFEAQSGEGDMALAPILEPMAGLNVDAEMDAQHSPGG